jgi:hypothetical protein
MEQPRNRLLALLKASQVEVDVPRASSGRGPVLSMGRDAGEPPIRTTEQPPATLMNHPMVSPTQQHQVREVGRAAIQPVPQMMGLTPGQRPVTTREDTAAVPYGQGAALAGWTTRVVRPTSSGWLGAPPSTGGNRAMAACSRARRSWWSQQGWSGVGWWLTSTRVTAPSQASR